LRHALDQVTPGAKGQQINRFGAPSYPAVLKESGCTDLQVYAALDTEKILLRNALFSPRFGHGDEQFHHSAQASGYSCGVGPPLFSTMAPSHFSSDEPISNPSVTLKMHANFARKTSCLPAATTPCIGHAPRPGDAW